MRWGPSKRRGRKRVFVLSALLGAGFLAGCIPIPVTEEAVFIPRSSVSTQELSRQGFAVEDFFFSAPDGTRLNAWYLSRPEARVTVLLFGGNGFYLVQSRSFVRALTAEPVNLLMIDYRGYGKSGGSPSVEALKTDSLGAYDELLRRFGTDPRTLLVYGHSLGSFPASYVASRREVAGLVLENPISTARDAVRLAVPWYLRPLFRFQIDPALERESNLENIAHLDVPLLVIAGGEDQITDPKMAEMLLEAAPASSKRLVLIPDGGHNGLHNRPPVREAYGALVREVAP